MNNDDLDAVVGRAVYRLELVDEERNALRAEVERLRAENEMLRSDAKEILMRGTGFTPGDMDILNRMAKEDTARIATLLALLGEARVHDEPWADEWDEDDVLIHGGQDLAVRVDAELAKS